MARHGSKAAAARATGLSEPTVAHHLKALERHAGVPLTRRVGRVTKVTPAGEADLVIGFADNATPAPMDVPVRPLNRDEYLVVLPDSDAQAKRKRADIPTLAGERWISGCAQAFANLLVSVQPQ